MQKTAQPGGLSTEDIRTALSKAKEEGAREGRNKENQEWLEGLRCEYCGDAKDPDGLADTCAECLENE